MCCDVVSRFARRVVCAAIFFLTLSLHASSSVTLAWDASASPNVTSYWLRYGTVSGSYPTVINAGNALTATVTSLTAGTTYYFVVTARNSSGLDSDPSNEATYTPPGTPSPNLPPTLNAPGNVTLSEDATQQTVNLSGIGSGAANESQTLVVTASSSNSSLVPTPTVTYTSPNATGTLRFTPAANANGTATITVTVNDGQALNNLFSRTFTVTVNPVNDPPALNSINDLTLNPSAGLQTVSLSGIGSGAANESQTLTVTASSSNSGLVPAPTVTYTSPNATGTLRFTPVANATGTATITVTVNDGQTQNNLATRTFSVTVSSTSSQPIYVEAESGTLVAPMVVATSASAANGQYVFSQTANQGTVRYPVNIPQAGDYSIWCRVLSPSSGTDSFFVSVDSGTEDIYDTVDNTWSSTWQWTRVNGRTTGNPRTFTLSQGTHTFTFRGRESSTFLDALYITKDPNFLPPAGGANLPPTLNAPGNITLNEDASQQTVNLSGIGSGAASESQTLVVTASSSNSSLVPTPTVTYTSPSATGTLRFTPVANASGTATITVTVNDGQALNNLFSRTFTVTVNPVNDPPAISNISDQSTSVNTATAAIPFTVNDAETSAASLTLSKSSSNPTLVPINNIVLGGSGANRTVTVSPAAGQTGNATITVTVSDGSLTANDSFILTVGASAPATKSFTNTAAITIPGVGNGNPYPSTINVSGMAGTISQVTVSLRNLNHTYPADVDVLLVGPGGQKAMICSDVGGSGDINNVTVTLSDGAASVLTATGQIVSGTYRPTNVEPGETGELDTFGSPAPGGPYGSAALSVFNGLSANGTWSLYVVDDGAGDLGSVAGGWSLTITTTSGVAPAVGSESPPRITAVEFVNGARMLTVSGEVDRIYAVEASSDLINWTRVGSDENTSGAVLISDPASGYPVRFYRAVSVASPVGPTQ